MSTYNVQVTFLDGFEGCKDKTILNLKKFIT